MYPICKSINHNTALYSDSLSFGGKGKKPKSQYFQMVELLLNFYLFLASHKRSFGYKMNVKKYDFSKIYCWNTVWNFPEINFYLNFKNSIFFNQWKMSMLNSYTAVYTHRKMKKRKHVQNISRKKKLIFIFVDPFFFLYFSTKST